MRGIEELAHEVEKVLVLSTQHMPAWEPDFGEGIRATEHEYGYIVFLTSPESLEDDEKNLPDVTSWMQPIVRLAWELGCSYINFDQDAGYVDGLKQWEW